LQPTFLLTLGSSAGVASASTVSLLSTDAVEMVEFSVSASVSTGAVLVVRPFRRWSRRVHVAVEMANPFACVLTRSWRSRPLGDGLALTAPLAGRVLRPWPPCRRAPV
jgi:hypothetical protein